MERRTVRHSGRMHIAKSEHVVKAIFPPIFVAAASAKLCRVLEGAEEHVPDRQVREIVGVMTKLMMNAMRLRPLEKVADPGRRLDVPMIEELADCDEQRVVTRGSDVTAEERIDDHAADNGIEPDLHRVLIEAGQDLKPTRRVVNLMQCAPQKSRFVPIAMPPVEYEGGENINDRRRHPRLQVITEMEQGSMVQAAIPSCSCQKGDRELNGIYEEDARPPCPNPREFHCRPESLCHDASCGNRKD
ncbi:MAG: hypothetical protein V7609_755 [Verrucomicrobiota bacterium]